MVAVWEKSLFLLIFLLHFFTHLSVWARGVLNWMTDWLTYYTRLVWLIQNSCINLYSFLFLFSTFVFLLEYVFMIYYFETWLKTLLSYFVWSFFFLLLPLYHGWIYKHSEPKCLLFFFFFTLFFSVLIFFSPIFFILVFHHHHNRLLSIQYLLATCYKCTLIICKLNPTISFTYASIFLVLPYCQYPTVLVSVIGVDTMRFTAFRVQFSPPNILSLVQPT